MVVTENRALLLLAGMVWACMNAAAGTTVTQPSTNPTWVSKSGGRLTATHSLPTTAPLTISPADNRAGPGIHSPHIVGTTPGRPFLFSVPATGQGPLCFSAAGLPSALSLNGASGIITGKVQTTGTFEVLLRVEGPQGETSASLTIEAGDHRLALTPPMGWNSWNCWGTSVDDRKIREAADRMVSSGLAAHGYQYVVIDDGWADGRDATGRIVPNNKFPDMTALADYVHSKGLRLGIYASPGKRTCGGYEGSYRHEDQDAATFAEWGIDYLKYDWCSYGEMAADGSVEEIQKPYRVMRSSLDRCGRDIVFSICEYGMAGVWRWGSEVGGNTWRTTPDIEDSWSSMSGIGFGHDQLSVFSCPGHWNDPDMLVVGEIGWGSGLHPSNLSCHEQVTHLTLWSLLAAPLMVGCDLSRLDSFTQRLLTNDEVLSVDQDVLGKAATRRVARNESEIWARPLRNGTLAVGLFNRGTSETKIVASWSDLGLQGREPVRDLWQRKDLGEYESVFETTVAGHGARLLRIGTPARQD